MALGAAEGATLNVAGLGAFNSGTNFGQPFAYVTFYDNPSNASLAYSAYASSGTVTIEGFRSGEGISGRYDVTFAGEREQGHFVARYCNAFDACFRR